MTLDNQLSDRVEQVPPSGIRKFFELAEEVDDVVSLGIGKPDLSTPRVARTAAIDSLKRGKASYTPDRGMCELHKAISERVTRYGQEYDPEDEIIVTTGTSEAVDLAFRAFVDPGDMVAIPQPPYISYTPGTVFAGGGPLPVPTCTEDELKLTPKALETTRTGEADMLVLCCPSNPTGAVMTDDELVDVASFVRDHDLIMLSNETYSDLRYEDDHASITIHPGIRERAIMFNGFSKAYAITGLHLGYAMGPPGAIDAMNKVHQYAMLSAPTTAQYAALEALRSCDDSVEKMRREYDHRRRFVPARFEEMGLDCSETKGALYVFPEAPDGDDEAFTGSLLEEQNVVFIPENVFDEGDVSRLRVSYAAGMRELREAVDRIEAYVSD